MEHNKEEGQLEKEFRDALDGCLESANADGQIKRVEIDYESKKVKFIFNLVESFDGLGFIEY